MVSELQACSLARFRSNSTSGGRSSEYSSIQEIDPTMLRHPVIDAKEREHCR